MSAALRLVQGQAVGQRADALTLTIPTLDAVRAVVREELAHALRGLAAASQPLLTVKEAAHLLGVSDRTIKRRITAGEIPATRIGRSVRIARSAVLLDEIAAGH
jgi:excisionase family DNA binding protein